jgi:hypothetical protein
LPRPLIRCGCCAGLALGGGCSGSLGWIAGAVAALTGFGRRPLVTGRLARFMRYAWRCRWGQGRHRRWCLHGRGRRGTLARRVGRHGWQRGHRWSFDPGGVGARGDLGLVGSDGGGRSARCARSRLWLAFGYRSGIGAAGVVGDVIFDIRHGLSSRGAVELQEGGCASRGRRRGTELSRQTCRI